MEYHKYGTGRYRIFRGKEISLAYDPDAWYWEYANYDNEALNVFWEDLEQRSALSRDAVMRAAEAAYDNGEWT